MSDAGSTKPTIAVVITARPSFARVSTVLNALAENPAIDLRIIMAASTLVEQYGNVTDDCPYPIAHRINSTLVDQTVKTSAVETGGLVVKLGLLFARERPACVVTIADRHETMATAIAASYQNIPLAHLQGGERTGNIDNKVRDAVSHLADLHFPATEKAAERLREMGVAGTVRCFGCPSIDLAAKAVPDPAHEGAIVVLQHPVTNEVDDARQQIDATLEAVRPFRLHPILWFWPGQDAGSEVVAKRLREIEHQSHTIEFRRHLPARDFLSLLRGASVLVGNSSAGIRECSYLGTPTVNIGTRQAGRECGPNVRHVAHDAAEIAYAIQQQIAHGPYPRSELYGRGDAGIRIAQALAEFVGSLPHETMGGRPGP